ncbi:hypothetical protein HDV04_001251 [Boothiomyces sp. JEL0838]|nr:hypothetical protein HDV04_001251 [Boothiomyces sp. JEL0838]
MKFIVSLLSASVYCQTPTTNSNPSALCGADSPYPTCATGCCSQYGFCGTGDSWCGVGSGCLTQYSQLDSAGYNLCIAPQQTTTTTPAPNPTGLCGAGSPVPTCAIGCCSNGTDPSWCGVDSGCLTKYSGFSNGANLCLAPQPTTKAVHPIPTQAVCTVYPTINNGDSCSQYDVGYATCSGDNSQGGSIAMCNYGTTNNVFVVTSCPPGTSCVASDGYAFCEYQCTASTSGCTTYPDISAATGCTVGQYSCSGTQLAICTNTDTNGSTGYVLQSCGAGMQCVLSGGLGTCQACP